ncbi:cytochrome P450 [Saccharothrix sp. ALI-22-I]|uniref:cytochrome P450 n=1 Tax=Saccharothrix sp. ALI-22-I TaxID=1933778 RepID=UPI00117B0EED|nr:cytochrome P450 [Saccharothrix sp. ALI-22-I]
MTGSTTENSLLAELDADPYPVYARLREEQPVSLLPEVDQWLVTRWDDVQRVLADPGTFTTDIPAAPVVRLCGGPPLMNRNGAAHQDLRNAIEPDYAPHRVNDHVDAIVRPWAEKIIAELAPAGHAELVSAYFEPVATLSHAELSGVDIADAGRLRWWGIALIDALTNFSRDPAKETAVASAMADMDDVLTRALARVRAAPDRSVLSHAVHAHRPTGEPRSDADVLPVIKQLAQAQLQAGWVGAWTLRALLADRGVLAEVSDDRWLVGAAVNEALRWTPPLGNVTRRTTRAVTLGGADVPAGAMLSVSVASANRDERVFDDPDRFDVHRDVRTNLGFGAGPHGCPAFAFVMATARTSLDVLLDRLPGVRPAPDWRPAPHGWKLRLPGPLDVVW